MSVSLMPRRPSQVAALLRGEPTRTSFPPLVAGRTGASLEAAALTPGEGQREGLLPPAACGALLLAASAPVSQGLVGVLA